MEVNTLTAVQPVPEERRPGEPVQPARAVNGCLFLLCTDLVSAQAAGALGASAGLFLSAWPC